MATEAKDLPVGDATASSTADATPTKAEVNAAVADVETLDSLKAERDDLRKKIKESTDPKRVEFWQSKADRLDNEIKDTKSRLEQVGPKWLGFIREGAARNLTAAQLLEHLEKNAKQQQGQSVTVKAGRADALEMILAENRAGHTAFAAYLTEELDLGTPVTKESLETHRSRFNRMNPEERAREAVVATPAKANGDKPTPPRVAGGSGAVSKGKGPAWQPGKKGVDLISAGLRGE